MGEEGDCAVLHVWVIALLGLIVVHDAAPVLFGGAGEGMPVLGLILTPLLMGAIAVLQHVILRAADALGAARGSMRAVMLADRTLATSRFGAIVVHGLGVLVFGWLDAIRAVVGDLIIIDELVAMTPAICVFIAGWWSYYPLESRLREAVLFRTLDSGKPVYPTPTRWQWVISNTRHQLLLSLLPLALIAAWSEMSPGVVGWLWAASPARGFGDHVRMWAELVGNLIGALVVFLLTPLLIRYVWDTVRLSPGPMRDRLERMCEVRKVRVRELLVWRTHGTMINGAVMGLAGPVRFILLTDALLDSLPERQVEAVMAHELAHAKLAHLPWLALALIAGIAATTALGVYALLAAEWLVPAGGVWNVLLIGAQIGVQVAGLGGGVLLFGFVSRRFEWQADAFAAKHLSVNGDGSSLEPQTSGTAFPKGTISREGASDMIGALESVAILNHIPKRRGSFRHGSIGSRQGRLAGLVGVPMDQLPIDRQVRRIKCVCALVLVAIIGLSAWEALRPEPRPSKGAGDHSSRGQRQMFAQSLMERH